MHVLPTFVGDGYVREKRPIAVARPSSSFIFADHIKFIRRHWLSQSSSHRRRPSLIARAYDASPIPAEAFIPTATTTRFVLLCILWYTSSALSSTTGKAILTQFRYPITLTIVQFGFIALFCLILMSPIVRYSRLRSPSKTIILHTLPIGMFQVGGHVFSSLAISRIPVSTVHTIKALSPLFTVAAYALLFRVSYSMKIYISLLPLTLGVMLACTFDISASNTIGLLCAFGSAIIFVSSNIFFKKIMPQSESSEHFSTHSTHRLDKMNLLFYSSSTAFVLMIPIWLYSDLPIFLSAPPSYHHPTRGHSTAAHPHSVPTNFVLNGAVHFAQNVLAFNILASTSPVTYSIASLIKRVAVICVAIVWFKQRIHPIQAVGIAMTFTGLWMYNSAKSDGSVAQGEKKRNRVERAAEGFLPTTMEDVPANDATLPLDSEPISTAATTGMKSSGSLSRPRGPTISTQPRPFHTQGHHHPPHNLHITIVAQASGKPAAHNLRNNSYPSPPPSLDSPSLDSPT